MKILFTIIVSLIFCTAPLLAQAQVHFDSGSARPKNPAAARDLDRQTQTRPRAKLRHTAVRCRDGSKHIARVCRRHGGVA